MILAISLAGGQFMDAKVALWFCFCSYVLGVSTILLLMVRH